MFRAVVRLDEESEMEVVLRPSGFSHGSSRSRRDATTSLRGRAASSISLYPYAGDERAN